MTKKNKYVSVQETRAQVTREKLLKAALKLVNQYGMKYLTVRNVCDAAGLSTGSFYNLFGGKDDLIAYYTKHVFLTYKKQAEVEGANHNAIERTLLIYRFYVQCCKEAGLEFVSALYSGIHNPTFNFLDRPADDEFVLDRVRDYLDEGKEKGEIRTDIATDIMLARIAVIVTGNIFYWCVFSGDYDLAYQVDDMLEHYLRSCAQDPNISVDLPPVAREGKFSEY